LDPLIKSQLLYQLSYAPLCAVMRRSRRVPKGCRSVQSRLGRAADESPIRSPPRRPCLRRLPAAGSESFRPAARQSRVDAGRKSAETSAANLSHVCALKAMVPLAGLEPARCFHHLILSQARLPIPPQGHGVAIIAGGLVGSTAKCRFCPVDRTAANHYATMGGLPVSDCPLGRFSRSESVSPPSPVQGQT
jgi:hypothetical protein